MRHLCAGSSARGMTGPWYSVDSDAAVSTLCTEAEAEEMRRRRACSFARPVLGNGCSRCASVSVSPASECERDRPDGCSGVWGCAGCGNWMVWCGGEIDIGSERRMCAGRPSRLVGRGCAVRIDGAETTCAMGLAAPLVVLIALMKIQQRKDDEPTIIYTRTRLASDSKSGCCPTNR